MSGTPVPASPYRKISDLPPAQPLTGTELIPADQNGTVKITASALSGLINGAAALVLGAVPAGLPNARTTLSGAGITFTDTGAGGSLTIAINNTITAAGPIGAANTVPVITYNNKGLLTAVTTATITPLAIGAASSTTQIATGTGLSGGGDLSANRTIFISPTIAAGGPTGSATTVPVITYNAQGQLTAVTTATITATALGALKSASNLSDVANVTTSRQNLGVDPGPGLQSVGTVIRPFIFVSLKAATWSAVDADRSTFFRSQSSASYTAALPAVATISSGWFAYFRNEGSGVLTVSSQNAGVTVGSAPSRAMQPGDADLIVFDGTNFQDFWPSPFKQSQTFNANGSFVPPSGVWRVMVEAWGPGGGGQGSAGGSQGNGGAGGSYGRDYFAVTPGVTAAVVVPAGGGGGAGGGANNGSAGVGAVTFAGTTLANAGAGGAAGNSAGGAAAAVLEAIAGQAGSASGIALLGNPGGSSPKGGPGGAIVNGTAGLAGVAPGGGGSGGSNGNAGGNGANGRLVVWF